MSADYSPRQALYMDCRLAPTFGHSDSMDERGIRTQDVRDKYKAMMLRMVELLRKDTAFKMDTTAIARALNVKADFPRAVARQYERTFTLEEYNYNIPVKVRGECSGTTARCSCTLHPHLQYR